MSGYTVLFFPLFVVFTFFKIKAEGEAKGKGPLDSWHIVNWSYGHRFIFFPQEGPLPPKESFQNPKKKQENYQERFLAGIGYHVICLSLEALLRRMALAWLGLRRIRIGFRGLRMLLSEVQKARALLSIVNYAGIRSFRLALDALSRRDPSRVWDRRFLESNTDHLQRVSTLSTRIWGSCDIEKADLICLANLLGYIQYSDF